MTAHEWARTAGLSLRPWSGHSPLSLIMRGLIQGAVAAVLLYFGLIMRNDDIAVTEAEIGALRGVTTLIIAVCAIFVIIAVARIGIGIADLMGSKTVEGKVVDVGTRRFGDILPGFAQEMIFSRRDNSYDGRRYRTEVVLETSDGIKSWTVRDRRAKKLLQPGVHVRMTVTPIAGSVSNVHPIGRA